MGPIFTRLCNVSTLRNTFKRNQVFPLSIIPRSTATFGSGVNADILGTGVDKNTYNAVGSIMKRQVWTVRTVVH